MVYKYKRALLAWDEWCTQNKVNSVLAEPEDTLYISVNILFIYIIVELLTPGWSRHFMLLNGIMTVILRLKITHVIASFYILYCKV